jgi:Fe-S cluster assembly scaffold protein SufB
VLLAVAEVQAVERRAAVLAAQLRVDVRARQRRAGREAERDEVAVARLAHVEPNCYSRELYKGILDGSAHGVFNGKVYVHPAAQKTDGKQTNNTLLLSEKAQIDTKPQLEIFADDVKCTHGATVGRLDETSLFYMKSRGINARTARELLTYAFAADVLETIELAEVREGLESATLQRYTELRGEGCGATLNGLYLGDGEQHIDHQTRIEHVEPNCYSREHYKGILDGAAHGVFNGKVFVHPAAQKTDGKQTNNTLLLSEKAQIDTKPQLEIFADDVKCTHGATVGRLDETSLFYMKSRGIDARTARELLTYAFAADVLETIEQVEVREALEAATLKRYTEH